jgi:hypothetical protein
MGSTAGVKMTYGTTSMNPRLTMIHRGVEEKNLGSLACGFFILITSCAVWGASLGLKSKVCARRRAARKP